MIPRATEPAAPDGTAPTPASPPDGTRALAGAILAGEPLPFGPRLVVVEGPVTGTEFALQDGAVLGRGRGAELRLRDPLASRQHAAFTVRDGRARLRDLSSKNGLRVNGRRVGPAAIPLDPGDALLVGESVLVYRDEAAPKAAAPQRGDAPGPPAPRHRATPVVASFMGALALTAAAALLALAAW